MEKTPPATSARTLRLLPDHRSTTWDVDGVEHLMPLMVGGQTVEENLWLSCRRCNQFKGAQTNALDPVTSEQVLFFNPRRQQWGEHFRWNEDGTEIIGITPEGRATVLALKLNHPVVVVSRRLWVTAGWWPPSQ